MCLKWLVSCFSEQLDGIVSKQFQPSGLKYAIEGGLRFAIIKEEELNIRFDFGIGNKGFYINVSEAF